MSVKNSILFLLSMKSCVLLILDQNVNQIDPFHDRAILISHPILYLRAISLVLAPHE